MDLKIDDSGDLQAYVKLMTEHQGNLRAFIVSLMPGSPDVPDVLQETNAALWQKRDRFELGSNFIAWAFQIARYEVHRQRDRTKRFSRIVFSEKIVSLLAEMDAPDDSEDELMTALDGCLNKLTDTQRKLVKERYTPGHSLEQHATDTGRSAGSLRIALLRIRETLKSCIEKTLTGQST
jgi:RNA polymerase sigma-70 factor (ECF subfamily)